MLELIDLFFYIWDFRSKKQALSYDPIVEDAPVYPKAITDRYISDKVYFGR